MQKKTQCTRCDWSVLKFCMLLLHRPTLTPLL